jgi:crotonobetainyl-CoA:carnitine CoA-transferase CaiB-like acyl-CoA transferase
MRRDLLTSDGQRVPTVRGPIVIDGEACVADVASPSLGEHTPEILKALSEDRDPWTILRDGDGACPEHC